MDPTIVLAIFLAVFLKFSQGSDLGDIRDMSKNSKKDIIQAGTTAGKQILEDSASVEDFISSKELQNTIMKPNNGAGVNSYGSASLSSASEAQRYQGSLLDFDPAKRSSLMGAETRRNTPKKGKGKNFWAKEKRKMYKDQKEVEKVGRIVTKSHTRSKF